MYWSLLSSLLYKVKDQLSPALRLFQGEEVTLKFAPVVPGLLWLQLTCVGHQVEGEVVRVDQGGQSGGDGQGGHGVRVAPQQLDRDLQLR